jgi:N-acetylmuramidase
MLKDLVKQAIQQTGTQIEYAALMAFIATESGGKGFDPKTGKILIQFEPAVFSRLSKISRSASNGYMWDENRVELQPKEWEAFNDAFKTNPTLAMESTSIGLPQIMGFHWKRLGYASVGAMWDDFKEGELNQIKALIKFLETDEELLKALVDKDWDGVAKRYNGKGYKALAKKLSREPYDLTMERMYKLYKGA